MTFAKSKAQMNVLLLMDKAMSAHYINKIRGGGKATNSPVLAYGNGVYTTRLP